MADHQSTRALANFAATLNAKNLPSDVRQKLGWLFLDYLRVCSIGARLPWSDWSRRYVGQVGKAGKSHALFERETITIELRVETLALADVLDHGDEVVRRAVGLADEERLGLEAWVLGMENDEGAFTCLRETGVR